MPSFSEPMMPFIRAKLARLKSASRGATISLINEGNTYAAYLADAVAAHEIAGPTMGTMSDVGDILTESVPIYRISYHQINLFLKLAESKASVALLDTETNGSTSKVECVFYQAKAPSAKVEPAEPPTWSWPYGDVENLLDAEGDEDLLGDLPDADEDLLLADIYKDDYLGDLL